ncbi:MAG: ABC transporter permease [Clostridiales bacterium]|nr:ABC transporter permease [Clostridiales bacterium]
MTDAKLRGVRERKNRTRKKGVSLLLNFPYLIWLCLFVVIPMFIVVVYAFTDGNGAFTLDNFRKLGIYKDNIIDSFIYALVATAVTLVLAYPFAYFMTKRSEATQRVMMMLVMLPMWMNLLILTYSIMNIIETNGIINNLLATVGLGRLQMINTPGAVIFGMVYNYFPYMVLPLYSVLSKIDPALLEAAADLGSGGPSRFRRVILPLSTSGIVSGVTMVFVPSVSTFYISQKLGGASINMIGDVIEVLVNRVSTRNLGAMLSLVLMVVILICIMIMNRFSDEEGGIML